MRAEPAIDPSTAITNTATITHSQADSQPGNNTASATTTVQQPTNADLDLALFDLDLAVDALEVKLDALAGNGNDALAREIEARLGKRECLSWMFTPAAMGGHREQVIDVVQRTIDNGRLLDCIPLHQLDEAQCLVDGARTIVNTSPFACDEFCGALIDAYRRTLPRPHHPRLPGCPASPSSLM